MLTIHLVHKMSMADREGADTTELSEKEDEVMEKVATAALLQKKWQQKKLQQKWQQHIQVATA
jgi:hypothetical protein